MNNLTLAERIAMNAQAIGQAVKIVQSLAAAIDSIQASGNEDALAAAMRDMRSAADTASYLLGAQAKVRRTMGRRVSYSAHRTRAAELYERRIGKLN